MIIYYGDKNADKIINAFLATPIKLVKDSSDGENFLRSIGFNGKYSFPSKALGVYEEKFQLDDEGNLKKISYLLIKGDDLNEKRLSTIVHECCHMVMNYGKAVVDGNVITSKIGVSEQKFEIQNGKVVLTLDTNTMLEEGMTEYNVQKIMKLIFGRVYNDGTYGTFVDYVSVLMDNEEIRKNVDQSRLDGHDNWISILGDELGEIYKNAPDDW